MHWERWMTETWQRGGRFIFLQEGLPTEAAKFSGTTVLTAEALLQGQVCTGPQDMVFVFESQIATLEKVDSLLQGQRILIGVKTPSWIEAGWADAMLPTLTPSEWATAYTQTLNSVKETLPDFRTTAGQPCLFLDRDDVVVKNVPYNRDPQHVELSPGIVELIHQAHEKNWWVALVTNQSGLGRSKITWEEYQRVHQQMLKLLAAQGAWLDECVWAGHIEEAPHAAGDFYAGLRKPRGGMFQQVDDKLKVHRSASIMIGDSATDVMAAYHAGIGQIYLLNTSRVSQEVQKLDSLKRLLPGLKYQTLRTFKEVVLK